MLAWFECVFQTDNRLNCFCYHGASSRQQRLLPSSPRADVAHANNQLTVTLFHGIFIPYTDISGFRGWAFTGLLFRLLRWLSDDLV
jgi:hypothetical protein